MNTAINDAQKVYTKNDMNNILFSGQKKKLSKIEKILFCIFSTYTFAILTLMVFVFKDILSEVFFSVGIVSMNAFAYTGYQWMSKTPFYIKREWKWFAAACAIGLLMPLMKFVGEAASQPYAAIVLMPLTYSLFLTVREVALLKQKANLTRKEKYIPLAIRALTILICLVIFLLVNGSLGFGNGTIGLLAILAIAAIGLIVAQFFIMRGKKIKMFLNGIGSFLIIPLSTLVGVFLWSTVVFATKFEFGAVAFGCGGLQLFIMFIGAFLLLKVKKEFEIPFIKAFVSNIFLLFIGAVGVGGKSIDSRGDGSFINSWLFIIAATVFYGILYLKDVKRSMKYQIVEGLTINILVFALLVITILQSMGSLNISKDIDIQTILTGVCLVPLFANSIMSAVDWIKMLKFKEQEITWK